MLIVNCELLYTYCLQCYAYLLMLCYTRVMLGYMLPFMLYTYMLQCLCYVMFMLYTYMLQYLCYVR
jgi:hypothetical protein